MMFLRGLRWRWAPLIICAACTVLVAAFFILESTHRKKPIRDTEFALQDALARYGRHAEKHPDIVYLAIDHRSFTLDGFSPEEIEASRPLSLISEGWPWSREVHGLILDRLARAGARVVLFDLLLIGERDGDEKLRAAADANAGRTVMGYNLVGQETGEKEDATLERGDEGLGTSLQLPADTVIPQTSPLDDRVGYVNFWPDGDAVIRRAQYQLTADEIFGGPPSGDPQRYWSITAQGLRKMGLEKLLPTGTESRRIRFAGRELTFKPRSVCDIFDPKKWDSAELRRGEFFRDKIVLVGPGGNFMKDIVLTPFQFMAGPELHLNALNAALQQDFLRETSQAENWLLIALGGVLAWAVCMLFPSPLLRALVLLLVGAGWLVGAQMLFNQGLVILAFVPLLAFTTSGGSCLTWDFFLERREKARIRGTLERYISKDAVKDIIDNPHSFFQSLGGVRKPVAILFNDLRGFTSLTEGADSQALVAQLNEYFGAMVEPILETRGALDKYMGDAIMAVWGNIQTRGAEEDVHAAVLTGLSMRERLVKLNERWKAAGKTQLGMGVGIGYGEAIVGNIGSVHQMNLTVIGDVVNLASRIEGTTKEFGVEMLISEEAAAQVRERFYLQSVGRVQVKGRARGTELFTVLGRREGAPDPALAEYLRVYGEAMECYEKGEFAAGREMFERAHGMREGETLSVLFAKRCAGLEQEPPEDWKGIYVMKTK